MGNIKYEGVDLFSQAGISEIEKDIQDLEKYFKFFGDKDNKSKKMLIITYVKGKEGNILEKLEKRFNKRKEYLIDRLCQCIEYYILDNEHKKLEKIEETKRKELDDLDKSVSTARLSVIEAAKNYPPVKGMNGEMEYSKEYSSAVGILEYYKNLKKTKSKDVKMAEKDTIAGAQAREGCHSGVDISLGIDGIIESIRKDNVKTDDKDISGVKIKRKTLQFTLAFLEPYDKYVYNIIWLLYNLEQGNEKNEKLMQKIDDIKFKLIKIRKQIFKNDKEIIENLKKKLEYKVIVDKANELTPDDVKIRKSCESLVSDLDVNKYL